MEPFQVHRDVVQRLGTAPCPYGPASHVFRRDGLKQGAQRVAICRDEPGRLLVVRLEILPLDVPHQRRELIALGELTLYRPVPRHLEHAQHVIEVLEPTTAKLPVEVLVGHACIAAPFSMGRTDAIDVPGQQRELHLLRAVRLS